MMRVIGLIIAALISIASLLFVVDVERWSMGMTTAPFGWQRLTLVHCLASLPVAWLISEWLARLVPRSKSHLFSACFGIVGIGIASWTVVSGGTVGQFLDANGLTSIPRLIVRTLWPVILQIPVCLSVLLLSGNRVDVRESKWTTTALCVLVLSISIVVPATYLIPFSDQQAKIADDLMAKQRTVNAVRVLQRLADVGVDRSFRFIDTRTKQNVEMSTGEALAVQRKEIERRIARISQLQATEKTLADHLELADHLSALDLTAEATDVLKPIASNDIRAAMEFGKLLQVEEKWQESSRWFQRALEQMPTMSLEAEEAAKTQSQIFAALARNARELKQYDEVEKIYLDALEIVPSRSAFFHAQLARHYEDGGRKLKAREHEIRAFEIAPSEHQLPPSTLFLWAVLPAAVVVYLLIQDLVLN